MAEVLVDQGYSKRYIRFVKAHAQAFEAMYLDGNAQAAANERERLEQEYKRLLPRHDCICYPSHCWECQRLAVKLAREEGRICARCMALAVQLRDPRCVDCARIQAGTHPVEIGRSSPVEPPMPLVVMLDINAGYAA